MNEHMPHTNDWNDTEGEIDVEDAFGDHDIAFWIRDGQRLVPATPTQIAAIREHEARLRLAVWRSGHRIQRQYTSHLQRIMLSMRRWFPLPLGHSHLPGTRSITPIIDTQATTSLTETRQKAVREHP